MTWQFSTAVIDQSLAPFIRAAAAEAEMIICYFFFKEIKNSNKFGKRNTRGQHLMLELKIKSRNNLRKWLATVFEFYDVESRKCDHSFCSLLIV